MNFCRTCLLCSLFLLSSLFVSLAADDWAPEPGYTSLFNGKDLTGWDGLPGYWKVVDGAIVGAPANGVKAHTFLCSQQTYKDFELKFKVRRKNGIGNSGVQFRSTVFDRQKLTMRGPQLEIDSAAFQYPPGSIVTEPFAKPSIKADATLIGKVWRDADFNDIGIVCARKAMEVFDEARGVGQAMEGIPRRVTHTIIIVRINDGFDIAQSQPESFYIVHVTGMSPVKFFKYPSYRFLTHTDAIVFKPQHDILAIIATVNFQYKFFA